MPVIDPIKILAEWKLIARKEISAAAELSNDELENGLRDFLPALNESLGKIERDKPGSYDIVRYCSEHGKSRALISSYNLSNVIAEFQILRKLILKSLNEKNKFSASTETLVMEIIDRGIISAVVEFTLLRGVTENRLIEALTEKNEAMNKLTQAEAILTDLGAVSEARENFVSAITHDLRNPLSAARLSAQMIKKTTTENSSLRQHAERIILCLDRTDRMIRDLLDSQRIQSGEQMPLKKSQVQINKILRDEVEELKSLFGDRFQLIESEEFIATIDSEAMRRIIENLCTNAVKYGVANGPITITLLKHEKNFEVKVHNIGNPINELEQKNIFQQFKRTMSAIESSNIGWGIGLTVVKGLTEAHGGKIVVESFPEKGTTFTVIFPM